MEGSLEDSPWHVAPRALLCLISVGLGGSFGAATAWTDLETHGSRIFGDAPTNPWNDNLQFCHHDPKTWLPTDHGRAYLRIIKFHGGSAVGGA